MKTYPDTSRAAIAELARSSTVSIRDLAAKYEDILFHARPTWLASPYLVPQVVPRGRHFDVVIVADGGRLPTAAALPSIVRAKQTEIGRASCRERGQRSVDGRPIEEQQKRVVGKREEAVRA